MEAVTQVWGSHLKQSLICVVERLSVQAIQNLRDTLRKSTRPPLNPDSEPLGCFPGHLPMIWWVRFQMGTHKTDLMWKPEAWSACKDGVRRQEKGLLIAASMKVQVITFGWFRCAPTSASKRGSWQTSLMLTGSPVDATSSAMLLLISQSEHDSFSMLRRPRKQEKTVRSEHLKIKRCVFIDKDSPLIFVLFYCFPLFWTFLIGNLWAEYVSPRANNNVGTRS